MASIIGPELERQRDERGGVVALVVTCPSEDVARRLRDHLHRRGWVVLRKRARVQVFWPAERTDQDAEAAVLEWWTRPRPMLPPGRRRRDIARKARILL